MSTEAVLQSFILPIHEETKKHLSGIKPHLERALSSSALLQMMQSAGQNAPYILAAEELEIDDCGHAFSTRFHHLEGVLVGICLLICNVVLAIFTSLFVVFTLGQCPGITRVCCKYWVHTAHATTFFVSSFLGIFSPKAAFEMNLCIVFCSLGSLLNGQEKGEQWQGFFQAVVPKIKQKLIEEVKKHQLLTKESEATSELQKLHNRISETTSFPRLAKVGYETLIALRKLES